jgi:hypothetical protein
MTRVGERPLHSVRGPSFCAILRRPSHVLLIVLRSTSSTAHTASAGLRGVRVGPATQMGALWLIQKTSRQQVEIPRFGGRSRNCVSEEEVKARGGVGEAVGMWDWDCRRTRTTSRGVTVYVSLVCGDNARCVVLSMTHCIRRKASEDMESECAEGARSMISITAETYLAKTSKCCPKPQTASFARATRPRRPPPRLCSSPSFPASFPNVIPSLATSCMYEASCRKSPGARRAACACSRNCRREEMGDDDG